MAKRISVLVALEGSDEGLKRAISSAEQSMQALSSSAKTAGDKAAAGLAEVKAGMGAFGEQIAAARTQLLAFLSINWAAGKLQEVVQVADAWNMMGARLKLATIGAQEYTQAQKALFEIAQRIGVPIQEVATLYGKLQQAVRMLGGEQQDALGITESISQALRISGASATEAQSALLQFGQALASGVLRGEEFNSVVENSPRLAQALADGLNVPIGRLRKMAEEGRLTADVVVNALMSQKDKLALEYAQLPQTVSQAFVRLQNAFGQWVAQVDASSGITRKLSEAMTWLSQNLSTVMDWLKRIAEVGLATLIYRLIPALITAWQTAGAAAVTAASASAAAWQTANLSINTAVASVGLLKTAFGVLGAFLLGWEIGSWLSDKFEFVKKAGIGMVEVLVKGVELLRYQWEVFAAIFTNDTIAQASQRHQERLAQMNLVFAQMYTDATKGSDAAQGAMNAAARTAEQIALQLDKVRQGTQEAVGRSVEAVHGALEKLKGRLGEVDQKIAQSTQVVNDATAKMTEAYKGLTTMVETSLARQIDAVKARFKEEQAALDLSKQSEADKLLKSTALLTDALTQQAGLKRQAAAETLKLIDEESKARLDASKREGLTAQERAANVTRVENEILATKRALLAQAAAEYRAHIDALNLEANRHLSEVKRIEEAKRALSMSTQDRIRELGRAAMTDLEALEDRKRQVLELQAKAREQLSAGEFERSRDFAQKAMDLAAQVASSQTLEAKRAEEARKTSELGYSEVAKLETQSREAYFRREFDAADALMRQADQLRAEIAQKSRDSDAAAVQSKQSVKEAIQGIRESEDILKSALDAEGQAHANAARAALSSRDEIQQTVIQTASQIEQLGAKLKDGLKLTLDADTSRIDKALTELDKALAEKERLLPIKLDLELAQKALQEFEQTLKDGKTLPVDADVSQARAALNQLNAYAKENSLLELRVTTEKAQASITNVEGMIRALDRVVTESHHTVATNVDSARSEIQSLSGLNTSSTHTVYVQRVEANASGGLVGAGVRGFASGGVVAPSFARMSGGSVPGSGDGDTVPRTLEAGSFVLRRAAVRKYGSPILSSLVNRVARFASGGPVWPTGVTPPKRNRDAAEAAQMIELGLQAMRDYTAWQRSKFGTGVSLSAQWETMQRYGRQAQADRDTLDKLLQQKSLSNAEKQQIATMKSIWSRAMSQPLLWGKDLERELLAYMEQHQGEFYAAGGLAGSDVGKADSVPAMLTPGEFVVNREAVSKLGSGFFAALNSLKIPAQSLAQRVLGFAAGGPVPPARSVLPDAQMAQMDSIAQPARTVRVELVSGGRSVNAQIDERDETRLLQLLQTAQLRAA